MAGAGFGGGSGVPSHDRAAATSDADDGHTVGGDAAKGAVVESMVESDRCSTCRSQGCGRCGRRSPRVTLEEPEGPGQGIPVVGIDGDSPDFHLRIRAGKYFGSTFRIPPIRERPGIGRSRCNAICLLADDQVSRFQAHFSATPDGFVLLCDGGHESGSGSSNGSLVNSNCFCIQREGHRLFFGDVIAVGSTEMTVESGAIPATECNSPPVRVAGAGGRLVGNRWVYGDTDSPRKTPVGWLSLSTSQWGGCGGGLVGVSRGRALAVLMGCHWRLGAGSCVGLLTDDALLQVILNMCARELRCAAAPPLPLHQLNLTRTTERVGIYQETPIDVNSTLFGEGRRLTAQEFLNASSAPFPGRCGGVGARPCLGLRVTRVSCLHNAALWRPYNWRKDLLVQRLPELLGRVVQGDTGEWGVGKVVDQIVEEILQRATGDAGCRDRKVQRDCLASSRHLEQFPLSTGPALDLASNEVDLAYFTVASLCAARISLLRLAPLDIDVCVLRTLVSVSTFAFVLSGDCMRPRACFCRAVCVPRRLLGGSGSCARRVTHD